MRVQMNFLRRKDLVLLELPYLNITRRPGLEARESFLALLTHLHTLVSISLRIQRVLLNLYSQCHIPHYQPR